MKRYLEQSFYDLAGFYARTDIAIFFSCRGLKTVLYTTCTFIPLKRRIDKETIFIMAVYIYESYIWLNNSMNV